MTGTIIACGEWNTFRTFGFFRWTNGSITMTVRRMNIDGYRPGDVIKLQVEVNNLSKMIVTDVSAEFVEEATLYAPCKKDQIMKSSVQSKWGYSVAAGESDTWHEGIQVPPISHTKLEGRRLIDLKYDLHVTAHVAGLANVLTLSCPITVGKEFKGLDQNSYRSSATAIEVDPYQPSRPMMASDPIMHHNYNFTQPPAAPVPPPKRPQNYMAGSHGDGPHYSNTVIPITIPSATQWVLAPEREEENTEWNFHPRPHNPDHIAREVCRHSISSLVTSSLGMTGSWRKQIICSALNSQLYGIMYRNWRVENEISPYLLLRHFQMINSRKLSSELENARNLKLPYEPSGRTGLDILNLW